MPPGAGRPLGSVERMPGRHLRRARSWWARRVLAVLGVLVLGAAVGAGAVVLTDDGDAVTAVGDGTARLLPEPGPTTIVLAGEVRAGGTLGGRLFGGQDPVGPFADVLGDADLAVVDLSAAVVEAGPVDAGGAAWVPAGVLDGLEAVGVDIVSVANDRSLDLGPDGLARTLALADGRPADVVGLGADEDAAYEPAIRTVGGVTVAVVAATQVLAPERIATDTAGPGTPGVASAKRVDRLVAAVGGASDRADLVVVYVHWGEDGATCPSTGQQELATALVDAGADVVAGPGSGRVQGAGRLGPAVVAYGLGTLVADGGGEAGALAVDVEDAAVSGWRWLAGRVVEGVAEPVDTDDELAAELATRQACAGLGP